MTIQSFLDSDLPTEVAPVSLPAETVQPATRVHNEPMRHILLGSADQVRQTIHQLHNLHYVEALQWSRLQSIPNNQIIITPSAGEVMSILVRHGSRHH
ncbi:MAG: hypothetical protein AAF921_16145 [Cyanobacteria bacterium P01_D01_bin.44]